MASERGLLFLSRALLVFALATGITACDQASETPGFGNPALVPGAPVEATVEANRTRQSISGFGASSAWTAPNLSDELSDLLFSEEVGVGLSLLRVRITPNGTTSELATAQKAVERGARVWAAPWSPPGMWKDNGSDINGGSLLPEHYQDWADRLAAFVVNTEESGVPLLMLSAQNEPNWTANWETCRWTQGQLATFVRDYLGPTLRANDLATPILAPETNDWNSVLGYGTALLEDGAASEFVGAIATHSYGGSAFGYTAPAEYGKEFWVTELDDGMPSGAPFDMGMNGGLAVARLIHEHLTIAGVNAWHYWWIAPRGDTGPTNAAITDGETLTRRAYVMGNWSKFVRPGSVRVEATEVSANGVLVTAFRSPDAARLMVVAVNGGTQAVTQRIVVTGGVVGDALPWITSDDLALEPADPVPVTDGAFDAPLPPRSVTTFVAELSALEPEPEPNQPSGGTNGDHGNTKDVELSNESGCSCRLSRAKGMDSETLFALLFAFAAARRWSPSRGRRA